MPQATPKRGLRIPRPLLALAVGGAAAIGVYMYVGSVQQAASAPIPRAKVLVAKTDLAAKTTLRSDFFEVRELPREAVGPKALSGANEASGKVLAVPMAAGEQLLASKLKDESTPEADRLSEMIPPGKRALSLNFTEVLGSGGLIVPGDHVDVLATFKKDTMGKDETMILLQDVLVLAVAQSTTAEELAPAVPKAKVAGSSAPAAKPGAADPKAPAPVATPTSSGVPSAPKARTVTVAVTPESAERLVLAEAMGQLRYMLRRAGESGALDVAPADLGTIKSPIQPASAEIVAVEISPTNVKVGDTVNVKITVKNTSNQPMKTQGPNPGHAYVQGQTYFSQQFASESGKWRVGIGSAGLDATELPYRWGFGADLAPGATTTVSGQIKITHDFKATNFYAAVVEEPSKVTQSNVGTTMITAMPENVAVVAVDAVNVRSGPSLASTVVGDVKYGTELQIIGQQADWFRVRLPDNREGWVAAGWIVSAGR
ncbi:MAG: Flp pilus assembly protein CpaB [Chloroflexi bacterium]|nr:Flp pilus assembly protein CpaB [Chloroflexota bacterium]